MYAPARQIGSYARTCPQRNLKGLRAQLGSSRCVRLDLRTLGRDKVQGRRKSTGCASIREQRTQTQKKTETNKQRATAGGPVTNTANRPTRNTGQRRVNSKAHLRQVRAVLHGRQTHISTALKYQTAQPLLLSRWDRFDGGRYAAVGRVPLLL